MAKKTMHKKEKIDLILLLLYPIFASLFLLFIKGNAFLSIIIFFAIPPLYLSFRAKKYVKKSLIFSLVLGLPLFFIVDYIAHLTKTWLLHDSILPFRFFNYVPLEDWIWAVFYIYFIVIFYEYFLDKDVKVQAWHKNMKYLVMGLLIAFVLFLSALILNPKYLNIPYFYLTMGLTVILLPILLILLKFPKLTAKFFKTGAYFFYLVFIYEITGLKLDLWSFPGTEFIGWVTFLGVSFPIEEFVFWIMLGSMAALSYYEFFDDDRK